MAQVSRTLDVVSPCHTEATFGGLWLRKCWFWWAETILWVPMLVNPSHVGSGSGGPRLRAPVLVGPGQEVLVLVGPDNAATGFGGPGPYGCQFLWAPVLVSLGAWTLWTPVLVGLGHAIGGFDGSRQCRYWFWWAGTVWAPFLLALATWAPILVSSGSAGIISSEPVLYGYQFWWAWVVCHQFF